MPLNAVAYCTWVNSHQLQRVNVYKSSRVNWRLICLSATNALFIGLIMRRSVAALKCSLHSAYAKKEDKIWEKINSALTHFHLKDKTEFLIFLPSHTGMQLVRGDTDCFPSLPPSLLPCCSCGVWPIKTSHCLCNCEKTQNTEGAFALSLFFLPTKGGGERKRVNYNFAFYGRDTAKNEVKEEVGEGEREAWRVNALANKGQTTVANFLDKKPSVEKVSEMRTDLFRGFQST